jgi:hypothetical protein
VAVRRSRHDREILRLAVPALGALAARAAVRLVTTDARFARRRWVLVGAPA